MQLEGLGKLKKFDDLIGSRTTLLTDLLACKTNFNNRNNISLFMINSCIFSLFSSIINDVTEVNLNYFPTSFLMSCWLYKVVSFLAS
jgi:hypothetical protein